MVAAIPQVPPGVRRPLWSVMIPTYNCATYLRHTLASVLAQDPGPEVMQIEVVDDGSTRDDPEAVVNEIGRGRVSFFRQPQNVGYIRNFATCVSRATGRLVHQLHGDDCVRDGFYRRLQRAFDEHPEIGAAFCRGIFMDEHGHWQMLAPLVEREPGVLNNWLERVAAQNPIQTPAVVVRREVYERLGGFDGRMVCWAEDWEMWVRIAAHYPVWYEPEPLALYRLRGDSISGPGTRSGQNMRDVRTAIGIIRGHLPPERSADVVARALAYNANLALDLARSFARRGERRAALVQLREALRCKTSGQTCWAGSRILARVLLGSGERAAHSS